MNGHYTDEDGVEDCCTREWLAMYQATRLLRTNGRWAVVARINGKKIAWAAYSPARGSYLYVVLLYGGLCRPLFGYDGTVSGFLRIVREVIIDDAAYEPAVLWHEGPQ